MPDQCRKDCTIPDLDTHLKPAIAMVNYRCEPAGTGKKLMMYGFCNSCGESCNTKNN